MEQAKEQAAADHSSDGDAVERFVEADIRAVIERRFGDKMLFSPQEVADSGGPSVPTQYRWMGAGILPYVEDGGRRKITRATVVRMSLKGAGPLKP